MAAWPPNLPVPRFRGFRKVPGRRATRFEPDDGPAKQRTTTTAGLKRIVLVYRCTVAQEAALQDFFDGDGAGGGAWFSFVQPWTGQTVNARFVVGAEPETAGDAPSFEVTVTLEVDAW